MLDGQLSASFFDPTNHIGTVLIAGRADDATLLTDEVSNGGSGGLDNTSVSNTPIFNFISGGKAAVLKSDIAAAANDAQVTGDPEFLIYSALAEPTPPAWFTSATDVMNDTYVSNLAVVQSFINQMAPG